MLAAKLIGAASGYALAWWVTHHEGAAAYGRFELALTVLTILALGSRLGLDWIWIELDWIGLDLDWIGLDWIGLGLLDWICIGLD